MRKRKVVRNYKSAPIIFFPFVIIAACIDLMIWIVKKSLRIPLKKEVNKIRLIKVEDMNQIL